MRNIEICYPPMTALSQFKPANRVKGGEAGLWAGDFEVGAGSLGPGTSSTRVLAVTRWSLPWNRYVMLQ